MWYVFDKTSNVCNSKIKINNMYNMPLIGLPKKLFIYRKKRVPFKKYIIFVKKGVPFFCQSQCGGLLYLKQHYFSVLEGNISLVADGNTLKQLFHTHQGRGAKSSYIVSIGLLCRQLTLTIVRCDMWTMGVM